jgi:dipeptidyl aminopeptidase/acylaminoacyl peptidase
VFLQKLRFFTPKSFRFYTSKGEYMPSIPLIPRKVLFGNPDRAQVQISPDGTTLAWLAPRDGVLNVWVAPRQDLEAARPVTHDIGRGIRFFLWAYTNQHILYIQDKNGDENWRVYSVDLKNDEVKDLTPFEGVRAEIQGVSYKYPVEIVVGLNNRDERYHDLYRLNLATGAMTLLQQNDGFMFFGVDDVYHIRYGARMTPDGGLEFLQPTPTGWEPWDSVPAEDMLTTNPVGFNKAGTHIFMQDSRGRNTSALMEIEIATKKARLLAEDPRADAGDVVIHPTEKYVQAVSFTYERKGWQILDASIEPDLAYLRTVADGEVEIISRTLDDKLWIVAYLVDNGPVRYYIYDHSTRQASFLFTNRPELEGQPLVKMTPVVIKSRDGLDLVAYYSLPAGCDSNQDGIPDQPLPMVFMPHGGPWWRDFWGYNPFHQWMANRGYAVLCVNFRSSTGFGKAFTNAGDKVWGTAVMQDQIDAVQWAIKNGIADPARVAVEGASFGGYSTLAGVTMFPETFACGVDLFGMSNLITLLESIPPYWKPQLEMFTTRVGDFRTEEGRELLKKHSPLTYVDRICCPLLIGQGANDPRVKQAEPDQIVNAMQAKNIPVTYVLYPDEGHGFARPENNLSFNAIAEAFLAKVLGGRHEPVGEDFKGSSLQVLVGVEDIPGLPEALSSKG